MSFTKKIILGLGLTFVLLPNIEASQWSFKIENDILVQSDGDYTSGVSLAWLDEGSALIPWQEAFTPSWFETEKQYTGLRLIQRMWTPQDINQTKPQPHDRPYAGLLELESHHSVFSNEWASKHWLSIGVIGPNSGTEWLQRKIHQLTNSDIPKGWSNQIENQLTIQYSLEFERLLNRTVFNNDISADFSAFSYTTIGNFRTQPNIGLALRFGNNLRQTFGQLSNHAGHIGSITPSAANFSWQIYTRAQVGYRFNDLSIEGKLPYQSAVSMSHKQSNIDVGVILGYHKLAITMSMQAYTKDYQSDPNPWHQYGALNIIWRL